MRKKKISLVSQGLIIVSVFVMIVYIITGYILIYQMKTSLMETIHERMLDVANPAAASLDGDYIKEIKKEDYGTVKFNEVNKVMRNYQNNIGLKYIYCLRKDSAGKFIIVAGPSMESDDEFGIEVEATPVMEDAMRGKAGAETEATTDEWGRFYSAFAPIRDSHHDVVGLVGVDYDAEWFDARVDRFAKSIINIGILSIIMGALGVFIFSAGVFRRLRSVNDQLNELGDSVDDLTSMLSTEDGEPETEIDDSHYVFDEDVNDMQIISDRIRLMRSEIERYINHVSAQAYSMIAALSEDYRAVCYVDLDADEGICYRPHNMISGTFQEGEHFPFREVFEGYGREYVEESFREEYLKFIDPDNIMELLESQPVASQLYMVTFGKVTSYELMKVARVTIQDEGTRKVHHAISVGLADVDSETKSTLERSKALSEALAIAEEANKAKNAFLSNMSHEIRTPMNAIIGFDHMALSREGVPEEVEDYLHKIDESAEHLLSIINNILDVSRLESGHSTLEEEDFTLSEEISQVDLEIAMQCREKGIEYEYYLDPASDGVYNGDHLKLKQILRNILGNAVKFTKSSGKITFRVEKTADFDDRSSIRFTIKDTGVGMARDFLPKVFDSFSQEDSSTKTRYGSTGLGMAITKNLVSMLNGMIEVESVKGEGTTFTVTVTLKRISSFVPVEEAAEEEQSPINLAGRRVLVAEDMDINAEILEMILTEEDILSERACNGKEALDMFISKDPGYYDVVLMDIRMPEMDGLEAAAAIRKSDHPDAGVIPIIALTANAFDEDMERSLQAGMNAHLTKPVVPEVLFENMRKYLRRNNG
ncbi:MAG: response regulator [Lachnospiraceae bacterium]|nr:response regulator [Lachnospiraceae bacterium]